MDNLARGGRDPTVKLDADPIGSPLHLPPFPSASALALAFCFQLPRASILLHDREDHPSPLQQFCLNHVRKDPVPGTVSAKWRGREKTSPARIPRPFQWARSQGLLSLLGGVMGGFAVNVHLPDAAEHWHCNLLRRVSSSLSHLMNIC